MVDPRCGTIAGARRRFYRASAIAAGGTGERDQCKAQFQVFTKVAGVKLLHVPYRGDPLPDLLSGRVRRIPRRQGGLKVQISAAMRRRKIR